MEGVIDGCIGCLDGLILRIQTSSTREVGNVKAFFSGHYQAYDVNVQVICDSKCGFTYVAVVAPVGMKKVSRALLRDCPYICTKHVLTLFPGEQKRELRKDAYNFYLSQL